MFLFWIFMGGLTILMIYFFLKITQINLHAVDISVTQPLLNRREKIVLSFCSLWIVIGSWGLYWILDDWRQPMHVAVPQIEQQIEQLEKHLLLHPDDGDGFAVIAPIYLQMGRVEDSIYAYQQMLLLQGMSVKGLDGLGTALVSRDGGMVSDGAQAVFAKAAELDLQDYVSRIYLARGLIQEGKKQEAIHFLQNFLQTIPDSQGWKKEIEKAIFQLEQSKDSENVS